ncbi:MAG: sodium:alanine symporter family protein [Ruminococcus sp.]|nr:sodium:alanine symporter family protein [Ruminococcus sp.]
MNAVLDRINGYVWGSGLIFLLLGTGALLTLKLGFIQLRLPFLLVKNKSGKKGGFTSFRTICMSLGTTMGTGNITGAAASLALGGAGSVFWMWVSAFLGMALVYGENVLSAKYEDNELKGPMAYISKGLNAPVLSRIFAFFCVAAALGMGSMVQTGTFYDELKKCCGISPAIIAAAVFAVVFMIIRGGANRIGTAAQLLLPLASAAYGILCIAIIISHRSVLSEVIGRIFREAFSLRSAAGGFTGYAVSVGIRRGIFSNEAGLGSSPLLHSTADGASPEARGTWAMLEVFLDTMVCCTLTALAVMCVSPDFSVSEAAASILGGYSPVFLAAELGLFALCTVIGWYYCGATCFSYLTGGRFGGVFCAAYAAAAALGILVSLESLWTLSDIFNGLMAFPNLLAILLLINKIKRKK